MDAGKEGVPKDTDIFIPLRSLLVEDICSCLLFTPFHLGGAGLGEARVNTRDPHIAGDTPCPRTVRSDDQLPPGNKERTMKVSRGQRARNTKPTFSAFSTKFKGALGQSVPECPFIKDALAGSKQQFKKKNKNHDVVVS